MTRSLSRLINPRSIAVFGGHWAEAVVRQCQQMGYSGDIWPVHPNRKTVADLPAYASITDLPAPPDAAFVGVNRETTIDIVGELAAMKSGGAVCFASGYREAENAGGDRLQSALVDAAGDMPILGPNCYGMINYCDGALLWPDQHGGTRLDPEATGAAIVTQSSNIAINMTMQARGLPIAYMMTAGNQAQTGISDIALAVLEDPRTSVLGLHIEGFDSVAGMERLAARAREMRKPVVAMKMGRSEQARAATKSHTASLSGNDAAGSAFLRRLGIAQVPSIPAFLETLKLLHVCGPLNANRISSMSCSGGEAAIMADSAAARNVEFAEFSSRARAALEAELGPLVSVANPLDYHTFIWNNETVMTSVFSAVASDGFDLNFLVIDFPRTDRCSDDDWHSAVRSFDTALKTHHAKGAVLASLPENLSEDWANLCLERSIAPMQGIDEALIAAEAASLIGTAWARPPSPPIVKAGLGDETAKILDEAAAKEQLAEFGLPTAKGLRADSLAEAVAAAETLGYPVVVKVLGIDHKSEVGAVRLDLSDRNSVEEAAEALLEIGEQIYVEQMIEDGVAELIVGFQHDPLFGPVMTIGSGGVLVELLEDSQALLLPADRDDIRSALMSLKLYPLLNGYRGRPIADIEAAIDLIAGIARFGADNADRLLEMDINPVIVCREGKGAMIADALIVERENKR